MGSCPRKGLGVAPAVGHLGQTPSTQRAHSRHVYTASVAPLRVPLRTRSHPPDEALQVPSPEVSQLRVLPAATFKPQIWLQAELEMWRVVARAQRPKQLRPGRRQQGSAPARRCHGSQVPPVLTLAAFTVVVTGALRGPLYPWESLDARSSWREEWKGLSRWLGRDVLVLAAPLQ